MLIIGCDYHPGFQQIAFVDTDTGELSERRLEHREPADQFYRELKQKYPAVRVGMESSGHSRWFERSPAEIDGDWGTSASKATCYCGFCWWKRRRSRCAVSRSGAASSFTPPCGVDVRLRRSRWRES